MNIISTLYQVSILAVSIGLFMATGGGCGASGRPGLQEDNRDVFQISLDRQYEVIRTEKATLDDMAAREPKAEVKAQLGDRLKVLQDRLRQAQMSIDDLKATSGGEWKAKRAAVVSSLNATEGLVSAEKERLIYESKTAERLRQIDVRVQEAKKKVAELSGDAKAKAVEEQTRLEEQSKALAQKYAELRLTTSDKWTELKNGLESSWSRLGDAFKDLFQ